MTYKGTHFHGSSQFQIAFACNHAKNDCEGKGNEVIVSDENGTLGLAQSYHDSEDAVWFETD